MRAVYKYPITLGRTTIEAPGLFEPLHVGMQRECLVLWAMVEPDLPTKKHRIQVYGTGWPIDEAHTYIGTCIESSAFVWHVFYQKE